jgi:hypothetical protein
VFPCNNPAAGGEFLSLGIFYERFYAEFGCFFSMAMMAVGIAINVVVNSAVATKLCTQWTLKLSNSFLRFMVAF